MIRNGRAGSGSGNTIAYGLARRLRPVPIYEALLEQDGIRLRAKHAAAERIGGLTVERIGLEAGHHATFAPGEGVPRLLATIDTASRQEVFPVLDPERRLIGLITLEDLLTLSAEPDLGGLVCAADVMRPPVAARPSDPVSRALELMMALGVRELPVIDAERRVLGLVGEVAIAHEYVRAHVGDRAELSTSGTYPIALDEPGPPLRPSRP